MALVDQIKNDPIPRELAFAPEEYAARVARVQASMAAQGLDLVILSLRPNLSYLTGYDTSLASAYAIGLVPAQGPVWIHCAELMAPCALLFSTIEEVEVYRWTDGVESGTQLARLLKDRGYDGKRIGVEKAYPETFAGGPLDARSFEIYQEELPNAEFTDATTLVLDIRLIKSPAEIEMIREAGKITAMGGAAAIDTIAEGVTDNQMIGAVEGAMIAGGVEIELQPGMCFHLANCYSMPAQYGAGFSESIAVTETGCKMLSPGALRELIVR